MAESTYDGFYNAAQRLVYDAFYPLGNKLLYDAEAVTQDDVQATMQRVIEGLHRAGWRHPTATPAPSDTLLAVMREASEWANGVFTQATPQSIANHLKAEAIELAKAPLDPEELADCLLLLGHLINRTGVDAVAVMRAKLEKNRQRKWGKPNTEGYVEHVEEAPVRRPPPTVVEYRAALQHLLDEYVSLVECGDCGFWNWRNQPPAAEAHALLERSAE